MAIKPSTIRCGNCYSNGEFGQKWTVWQVHEIQADGHSEEQGIQVQYRVLVGKHRRKYKLLSLEEFARQVRYEVELVETTWQRIK